MKKLTLALVCLLALLCTSALAAQEGVSVSPPQLDVAGEKGRTVTRTLLIRTGDAVAGLRVIPLDLVGTNGNVVLPAEAISIALPADSVPANTEITVPVTFDLAGAPSGQFTGELRITHNGQSHIVPVNVAIKDQPWLPLVALVGGVALGIGVSAYRAKGRPRDAVLVRLGQIRTQMKVDKELQEIGRPFHSRIDAELVDVEVALEGQQWEKAQQAVMEAEALWTRWRRGRPDWLVQLDYYNKLLAKLDKLGESIFYVNEIKEAARSVHREMPGLENPDLFRTKLDPLTRQVNGFIALDGRITALKAQDTPQSRTAAQTYQRQLHTLAPTDGDGFQRLKDTVENAFNTIRQAKIAAKTIELEALSIRLPETDAQVWQTRVQDFKTRAAALAPGDDNARITLEGEIDAALWEIKSQMPSYHESTFRDAGAESYNVSTPKGLVTAAPAESWLSSPPTIHVQSLPEQLVGARKRLRWFTWLTYIVAVVFLALAGFVELYDTRLDFGANGIGDYFTLMVWGFGAEATRAAIADMVQGWGISTGK